MSKEWYEESSEAFANGFTEERQVHQHDNLRATYGKEAPYSEHKRGEHITYTSAEGVRSSGVIIWVQAPFQSIGVRYVVAPDEPTGFVDFVVPGDVLQVEDVTLQEQALVRCSYCGQMHQANQVEQCPLKPGKE